MATPPVTTKTVPRNTRVTVTTDIIIKDRELRITAFRIKDNVLIRVTRTSRTVRRRWTRTRCRRPICTPARSPPPLRTWWIVTTTLTIPQILEYSLWLTINSFNRIAWQLRQQLRDRMRARFSISRCPILHTTRTVKCPIISPKLFPSKIVIV